MGERTAERDCVHGSLARSCERCDLEAELRASRERVATLEGGIREALDGPVSTNARTILAALLDASHDQEHTDG